jgi:hypothetical protein
MWWPPVSGRIEAAALRWHTIEYHELAGLSHNREYGKSDFATIGTFWRVSDGNGYASQVGITRWRDNMRIGWISMRQAGWRVIWAWVRRVLRHRFVA